MGAIEILADQYKRSVKIALRAERFTQLNGLRLEILDKAPKLAAKLVKNDHPGALPPVSRRFGDADSVISQLKELLHPHDQTCTMTCWFLRDGENKIFFDEANVQHKAYLAVDHKIYFKREPRGLSLYAEPKLLSGAALVQLFWQLQYLEDNVFGVLEFFRAPMYLAELSRLTWSAKEK